MRTLALFVAVPLLAGNLCGQATPTITNPGWQRCRAVWFGNGATPSIAAEIGLGCESSSWQEAAKTWDAAKVGDRLPLATSMWATLETFTDAKFGTTSVPAGNYYAVLEKGKQGWVLGLLDSSKVRSQQLEPGTGGKMPLAIAIELTSADGSGNALNAEWQIQEEGATLCLHCGPHTLTAPAKVQGAKGAFPLAQPAPRRSSRAAFGTAKAGSLAFATVEHGAPSWKEEHAKAAAEMKPGSRWRLGQDWATTLDTNLPLAIGGKKLAAGSWHLSLAKASKDKWNLVVSSAEADHKAKIDGFGPDAVTPVLEIPLRAAKASAPSEALRVEFAVVGKETQLAIAFGESLLNAVVTPGTTARN